MNIEDLYCEKCGCDNNASERNERRRLLVTLAAGIVASYPDGYKYENVADDAIGLLAAIEKAVDGE